MNIITHNLGHTVKEFKIIPLGDLHIGSKECDLKGIQKLINQIKYEEDTYCILTGDIINNGIKSSVSDVYEETMTPQEQQDYAVDLLRPIKDKILAAISGNHEHRTIKDTSNDPMRYIMGMIGKLDVYSRDGAVIFISFGSNKFRDNIQHTVSIYSIHGKLGGGRKLGLGHVQALNEVIDADIYTHSHTHKPGAARQSYFRTDTRWKTVTLVDRLYVNTASLLDYGGYGQRAAYAPSSKKTPSITIWYEKTGKGNQELVRYEASV